MSLGFQTLVQVKEVTPNQASVWLKDCAFPGQRRLRPWHVKELENEMRKGRFLPVMPVGLVDCTDGKSYLVNGQHTLHAIVEYGAPVCQIVATYTGATYDDVVSLYSHFDTQNRRTFSDAASASGTVDRTGLTHTQLDALGGALEVIYSGFDKVGTDSRLPVSDKLSFVEEWSPEMRLYAQTIAGANGFFKQMKRASVCAVAIVTIRYCPADRTDEFWRQVALDDGLKRGDPRKALREFLAGTMMSGGNAIGKKAVTWWQMSRAVAHAWNAWQRGESLQFIRLAKAKKPIVILGTPYDGTEDETEDEGESVNVEA